jgi:hypothetical protein
VSKNVFEEYRLATYAEASFKPFVIAAVIFLTRFEKPLENLERLISKKNHRWH